MKISDVFSMLTSIYIDWHGYLANPKYCRNENEITWSNCDQFRVSEIVSLDEFIDLVDRKQYSYQIADDGAIVQLYYLFNQSGDELQEAHLAYFRAIQDDLFGDLSDDAEMELSYSPISWLRVDYEPALARGVLHSECHLHVGGFPNARFIVDSVPTPKQFMEFIMALCYQDIYQEHRLREDYEYANNDKIVDINRPTIETMERPFFRHMTHLRVPKS